MLLEMAAEAGPDREAIRCGAAALSYGELLQVARSAAAVFRDSGARSVAWTGEASVVTAVAFFGAAFAGLPYVPINYRLTESEMLSLLDRLDAPYVFSDRADFVDGRSSHNPQEFLGQLQHIGSADFDAAMTDPESVAVQLFTSGTTGVPKSAVLRNSHLVSYILGSVEFASAGPEQAVLVSVPPYHIAGISALMSATYSMRRIVLLPAFDAAEWLALAENEKVTHAFLVPTMVTRIVDVLRARGAKTASLPHLSSIAYGGGKMPKQSILDALAMFPDAGFTNAYGLTETSSTISVLGPEDHRAALESSDPVARQRLTSVGKPLPGIQIEIRDAAGKRLQPGESGGIFVRGEQVAGEYVEQGSLLDEDQWFYTRDDGFLDEQGFLFLEGRSDDVIVRGGENISPGEVEQVLEEHPGVIEAAVVGIASEQWGEAVAAAVVPATGETVSEESLQAFVRESLRSSRMPEKIVFVDQLPYNETGKLLRREVKRALSDPDATQPCH
ncbi:MAG: fatty acid--CoA ligase family protein [Halieaceae bacterium]|nr:fatty acid--CoA ligase family protein [Halieaceae bacterium]